MAWDFYAQRKIDSISVRIAAGAGAAIDRNRCHIADGQAADVNVGQGANILDSPMSVTGLQQSHRATQQHFFIAPDRSTPGDRLGGDREARKIYVPIP